MGMLFFVMALQFCGSVVKQKGRRKPSIIQANGSKLFEFRTPFNSPPEAC